MRTSGIRLQPSARIEPPRRGRSAAVSREVRKPRARPRDDRLARGGHALVVEAERAEAAGRRRVGGDVHVLGAVAQRAEVARLEEARAGVRGLGAVDAVELGRVADRLVHLQLHLLGVDHDRRHAGRALVGAQQRGRLLGDARRLPPRSSAVDVLPAGLRARADVRARVAADLRRRRRATAVASMPPPHSTSSCSTSAPSDETKQLVLALRADRGLRDLDLRVARAPRSAREAERDLVRRARPSNGSRSHGRAVACPRARSTRRERARVAAAPRRARTRRRGAPRRARPRGRAAGRTRSPRRRRRARGRRSPRSRRRRAVSTRPFFVADRLRAADDGARVGVRSAGAERGVDGVATESPHAAGRYHCTSALSRAGGGIGRRARLRA